MLTLDSGLHLCEQGKVSQGILRPGAVCGSFRTSETDLQRVIRTNLALWSRQTHRLRFSVQPEGVVDIERIAFSPDGRRFLTAGRDEAAHRGEIRLWDAASGEPIGPAIPHPPAIWALAVGPDGKTILSGSGDFGDRAREVQAVGGRAGASLQPRPASSRVGPRRGPQPRRKDRPDGMRGRSGPSLGRGQRPAQRSHPLASEGRRSRRVQSRWKARRDGEHRPDGPVVGRVVRKTHRFADEPSVGRVRCRVQPRRQDDCYGDSRTAWRGSGMRGRPGRPASF